MSNLTDTAHLSDKWSLPTFMTYQLCFLVVLGDVCILMETEDLGEGVNGEGPNVVNVALVGTLLRSIVQTTGGESSEREGHTMD